MFTLITAVITFVLCFIAGGVAKGLLRAFGVYDVVEEGRCRVYTLFGNVEGIIKEPGIHFLWKELGWKALLIRPFGKVHTLDMRLDQEYLRSQPVNSEEGAPMGIGVWYEMFISDPVAYLFSNADPRGSLRANVQQRHGPLPLQHAAGDDAREPPRDEPAVRSEVTPDLPRLGLPAGQRLHPQGALPRRRHDPADRGEGREPPAPGDRAPSSRTAPTR